ncbi:hypothetical protein TWF481_007595 [Arthrobotrys musiformis]|uniref:DUF4246 domain-containing protein n=1 Tax=Arthrobotrys musiformis TaxID=47236 RepID=A0AAV9WBX3_9PEZI
MTENQDPVIPTDPPPKTEREKPYPHPLDLRRFRLGELQDRELSIQSASLAFRDLEDWTQKLKDRTFVVNWLRERQQADFEEYADVKDFLVKPLVWGRDDVTMWFNELAGCKRYIRRLEKEGLRIEPDVEGAWRVDMPVEEGVRKGLADGVLMLENIPEDQKLWRFSCLNPNMVLDVLDPSIYPIIYKKTTLNDGTVIEYAPYPIDEEARTTHPNFCWLPSEFTVSKDGKSTKIASYINNLSLPSEEKTFHPILEKVFTAFVPLFNHVLAETERQAWVESRCVDPTPWKSRVNDGTLLASRKACEDATEELLSQMEKTGQMKIDPFEGLGVPGTPRPERHQSMFPIRNSYKLITDAVWTPPKISRFNKLEGRTAKVVVSMVNILLSPENPEYKPEEWQLNGFRNERIIATGIYTYAQENITEPYLSLRRRAFGKIKPTTPQEIESIRLKDNRAIVYPNIHEHRLAPFHLLDPSKPGFTKLLIFYYCDPSSSHTLQTTSQIPPQQPNIIPAILRHTSLGHRLPEEVFVQILSYLPDTAIPFEEAVCYRQQMYDFQQEWMNSVNNEVFYDEYERDHYYGLHPDGYDKGYSSEED